MAKCVKCGARKGKRWCPALEARICSRCCAEHRLQTIACPQDCPHLEGEHYQLERRKHRARSSGRSLLDTIDDIFYQGDEQGIAFLVFADVYWWMRRTRRLGNRELAHAFDDAKSRLSRVYVPSHASPLGQFIAELFENGSKHNHKELPERRRREVLAALSTHASSLPPEGHGLAERIEAYFDQLDFESDLDYNPLEELGVPPGKERELLLRLGAEDTSGGRRGGLILPGG